MKLSEVQNRFHAKALEIRAIDAFVNTDRFEDAFARASPEDRERLLLILKSGKLEAVRSWVKDRLAGPLRFRSYRQLRDIGRRENVPLWSRLTRDELLEVLEKKANAASL